MKQPVKVSTGASTAPDVTTSGADARSNTANSESTESRLYGYNGATWDRIRTAVVAATGTLTGLLSTIGMGVYNTTRPAATNGQVVGFQSDTEGKQIVLPYARPADLVKGAITTAMTATTSTSLIAAPGAGLFNYITQVTVSNSHATVGTDVVLQDGSGGTTMYTIPAAANYGGASITFNPPLKQTTANTALFCANVTTGSSIKVSAAGYIGA